MGLLQCYVHIEFWLDQRQTMNRNQLKSDFPFFSPVHWFIAFVCCSRGRGQTHVGVYSGKRSFRDQTPGLLPIPHALQPLAPSPQTEIVPVNATSTLLSSDQPQLTLKGSHHSFITLRGCLGTPGVQACSWQEMPGVCPKQGPTRD